MKKIEKPHILLVDDEPEILHLLADTLREEGYRVHTESSGTKVIETIGSLIPDLILLDIFMPHCNGMKLLEEIRSQYPEQKIIMISGFGTIPLAIQALKKGALDFIEKPPNVEDLLTTINKALKPATKSEEKIITPSYSLPDGMVGESYTFKELIRQVHLIGPLEYPVLIYGEKGTGKTTLARYIATMHRYAKDSFTMIQSNTDYNDIKQSHVQCGTILLKNIDQFSVDLQQWATELIRESSNTVRILASSTKDLYSLTKKQQFDSSLFYALNIIPLEIPPLRKHPYDIPLLVDYYTKKINSTLKSSVVFSASAIRHMCNMPWPGNITQLINTITRSVSMTHNKSTIITPSLLIDLFGEKHAEFIERQSYRHFASLEEATITFEKKFLTHMLKKNHHNVEQLSAQLNMSTVQLRNKLLELNIE